MSDDVKPWDLLNPKEPKSPEKVKEERLAICEKCPYFRKQFRSCKLCGCFMDLKTTLKKAKCPDNRW